MPPKAIAETLCPIKKMKVEIINTDWFLGQETCEGTVTFKGKNGGIIDAFSYGEDFATGAVVDVDFTSIDYDLKWDVHFSENKNKNKFLVKIKNWEYEGYGQIKSIKPVIIDFGDIELNTGDWINDEKVIEEFIYWKIDRLDIYKIK
jgi:hypothetical protein